RRLLEPDGFLPDEPLRVEASRVLGCAYADSQQSKVGSRGPRWWFTTSRLRVRANRASLRLAIWQASVPAVGPRYLRGRPPAAVPARPRRCSFGPACRSLVDRPSVRAALVGASGYRRDPRLAEGWAALPRAGRGKGDGGAPLDRRRRRV